MKHFHVSITSEIERKLTPVMDTMDLLSGRWRIIIVTALYTGGKLRFNELKKYIPGITGRSLSADLKYLEEHGIVAKTIKASAPITVEYELTPYGLTLESVFEVLTEWGMTHRRRIIGR